MASTITRERPSEINFIDHEKDSETPGFEIALDRLIGELVCAFFVAMAVMWVVTTVASVFA